MTSPKIMDFFKNMPEKISQRFIQIVTTLLKGELKKAVISDNPEVFEKSKITDLNAKLYLVGEDDDYLIKGVEIKRQKPKFHYKIKSDI